MAALLCGAAALAAAPAPYASRAASRVGPQAAAPAAPNLSAPNIGPQLAQLLAPLGAGPAAGYTASGRAVVYTPAGSIGGPVRIAVWGSRHCRVQIDLPGGQRYERVVSHPAFFTLGFSGLPRLLPPGGLGENCDLLVQGLSLADLASAAAAAADLGPTPASGGAASASHRFQLYRPAAAAQGAAAAARIAQATQVTLDVDNATGRPVRAIFTAATGETVEDDYSNYPASAAIPYAAHVETSVNGVRRLVVDLTSMAARGGFTAQDFAAPAGGPPARAGRGGQ